jgi:hypothetical protein
MRVTVLQFRLSVFVTASDLPSSHLPCTVTHLRVEYFVFFEFFFNSLMDESPCSDARCQTQAICHQTLALIFAKLLDLSHVFASDKMSVLFVTI